VSDALRHGQADAQAAGCCLARNGVAVARRQGVALTAKSLDRHTTGMKTPTRGNREKLGSFCQAVRAMAALDWRARD
jgi:hypothetical protein